MTLYEKENEIAYLKGLITDKLKHSYMDQYIEKIAIDDEKINILDSLLNNFPKAQKEGYIITVSLIQIALNTHDNITEGPEPPDHTSERISKQLSVLAGDYYSGLYYLLLSELQDFKMIHTLATAIKDINELKMKLYYQEYSSLDEFINMFEKVNAELVIRVAEYIGEYTLHSFISEWLLLTKLIHQNNNGKYQSHVTDWLHHSIAFSKEEIEQFLSEKINSLIINLKKSIKQIPDKYLNLKVSVMDQLKQIIIENEIIISTMEEG